MCNTFGIPDSQWKEYSKWLNKKPKYHNLQRYFYGNIVYVHDSLLYSMNHFPKGQYAVVIGSYADQYGGNNTEDYTLYLLKDKMESSWYPDDTFTLIDRGKGSQGSHG